MGKKYLRWFGAGSVSLLMLFSVVTTGYADQGFYLLDKAARPGMLMSLTSSPDVVEPATDKTAEKLVGIMVAEQSVLDIQPEQIQVNTGGITEALVSTINGDIKQGDRIAPSSIVGFGAKQSGDGWIVGIAQDGFNANTQGAVKSMVTDNSGGKHDVFVGNIKVLIKVTHFSEEQPDEQRTVLPEKLQEIADSIAGKRATQVAVILSFLLILGGLVVAGVITNSAIRNGIVSIARQPLTKQTILRQMLKACLLALTILVAMIVGAFIVLRIL